MELLPGQDRKKAEAMVDAELKRLADEPVSAEELARVRQGIIAGAVFDRESVHQLADNIAQGVTLENLDWLRSLLPKIAAVTAEDVQRVAKKYLDPQKRVVVWSVPKEGAEVSGGRGGRRCRSAEAAGTVPFADRGLSPFSESAEKKGTVPFVATFYPGKPRAARAAPGRRSDSRSRRGRGG